jgi:hypothetical protein
MVYATAVCSSKLLTLLGVVLVEACLSRIFQWSFSDCLLANHAPLVSALVIDDLGVAEEAGE